MCVEGGFFELIRLNLVLFSSFELSNSKFCNSKIKTSQAGRVPAFNQDLKIAPVGEAEQLSVKLNNLNN